MDTTQVIASQSLETTKAGRRVFFSWKVQIHSVIKMTASILLPDTCHCRYIHQFRDASHTDSICRSSDVNLLFQGQKAKYFRGSLDLRSTSRKPIDSDAADTLVSRTRHPLARLKNLELRRIESLPFDSRQFEALESLLERFEPIIEAGKRHTVETMEAQGKSRGARSIAIHRWVEAQWRIGMRANEVHIWQYGRWPCSEIFPK